MNFRAFALFVGVSFFAPPLFADEVIEVDRVMAIVDNHVVTSLQVRARLAPIEKSLSPKDPDYAKKHDALVAQMVQQMIDEALVAQAADREKLVVDESEVKMAVTLIARDQHLTEPQLEEEVKKQGLTMNEYRTELRRQLLEAKYVKLDMAMDIAANGIKDEDKMAWIAKRRLVTLKKLRDAAVVELRP